MEGNPSAHPKMVGANPPLVSNRKRVEAGLIANHLTARGLAYWIMCDGSLQRGRRSLILHTQGYTEEENLLLSRGEVWL